MKKYSLLLLTLITGLMLSSCAQIPADMILANGEVYTMEENNPWASTIVITGNEITAVLGEGESYDNYVGDRTRVIDLNGRFVTPGIIDGHTHFNGYGAQINDVDLLTVSDDEGLKTELRRVVNILEDGEWITGGIWGAYEEWALGAAEAGQKKRGRWEPDRWSIDEITENNPCLLSSFDRKLFLANTPALEAAGLVNERLEGMKLDRRRRATGLIYAGSPALRRIRDVVKPKSEERILDEMRAGLKALAEQGITEIHDITPAGQDMRYAKLEELGDLTCRIWMRPDLSRGAELQEAGLTLGVHPVTKLKNDFLRFGALKGYIDGIMGTHGALFFEPYNDQPDNYGHYRRHTSDDADMMNPNMEKMYDLIKVGYEAGFVSNVHAIGTKGVALMLDTYERLMNDLGKDLEGFRVIHAQVIREQDFPRFKALSVIAEVNPYHVSDDMRWMEERIGSERCKGAYAFKSLLDNGAVLSFGSDIPGTSAAKYLCHPKYLIHASVNRTTLSGEPEGGWFPEEKISVHEALKAFTINNAHASFSDGVRGSIKTGKFADITVFDKNMIRIDPKDILSTEVDMTIVDGQVVFERK
ncbi:MAG: amidohydrolase [bacterium]|nr:amidohydrolase [bacterium]